ncbi:MAG: hypothetical protein PHV02_07215 [Rhodocyclaceae bacterium]|nr:hypothetical protein [Rhodocyclaceae bacterium]
MDCKYHLVSVLSEIYEDDYENGEGDFTGCGLNCRIGKTFNTLQEMIAYLAASFGLSENIHDFDAVEKGRLVTSKTVANHCEAQNGGWFEATEKEIKDWAAGKMKLYSENFSFHFLRCL